MERELAEERNDRAKVLDENSQLKDEISQSKEEYNQVRAHLVEANQQLKLKTESLIESENSRNDLQKIIQLKTNERNELEESLKEEKSKTDYIIKEKESEIDEVKSQVEAFSKQLNEAKIQLYNLESKQQDVNIDLVMNFIEKQYKKYRKQIKREQTIEFRKRRNSIEILHKIKEELQEMNIENMSVPQENDEEDSDEEILEEETPNITPQPALPKNVEEPKKDVDMSGEFVSKEQYLNALETIKDLESQKDALLGDLANRVEKVIGLEMQLDEVTDKYNTLSNHKPNIKKYTSRIEFLERNLDQVTASFQELHTEVAEMRSALSLSEKKVRMKEERIVELNNQVLEHTRKTKQEADAFVEERSRLNDIISALRYEVEMLKNDQVLQSPSVEGSKVRRPVRGGGNRSSFKKNNHEEDDYFSVSITNELDVDLGEESKYATIRHSQTQNTAKKPQPFSLREYFFGKTKSEQNMEGLHDVNIDQTL